jgi:hypothetical protein
MTTPENADVLQDWRGNAYTIGDRILYPRMSGRSCEMQEGRVTKINRDDKGKVSSVGVQPHRSSRYFGRYSGKAVTILIVNNITRVLEPDDVVAMPWQEQSVLDTHVRETHGDSLAEITKQMQKAAGKRYWSLYSAPAAEIAEYYSLVENYHQLLHEGETQNGIVHVHDHNLRSHDFEQRVERTERRTRVIGWKNKESGVVWDRDQYAQATGVNYGFDHSPPDWRDRDRYTYNNRSYYNGYDAAGRRILREPWVSKWERLTEEYDHEFFANYCKHCDVKMDQNNHGRKASIDATICEKNAPNNEESE